MQNSSSQSSPMPKPTAPALDFDKIDDAVLALLLLGLHEEVRAWKSFDWAALARLHARGLISDPVGKAKSVVLTAEGLAQARRLQALLFGRGEPDAP